MTISETIGGRQHEYAAVLVQTDTSPAYRLKAPDNTTVETYRHRPSNPVLKKDVRSAGYSVPAGAHIPHRDMRIENETLPGSLTL